MTQCRKCWGDMDRWTEHKVGDQWFEPSAIVDCFIHTRLPCDETPPADLVVKLFDIAPIHLLPCFTHTLSCSCLDVARASEPCVAVVA